MKRIVVEGIVRHRGRGTYLSGAHMEPWRNVGDILREFKNRRVRIVVEEI